jgi:hypothetical protein
MVLSTYDSIFWELEAGVGRAVRVGSGRGWGEEEMDGISDAME